MDTCCWSFLIGIVVTSLLLLFLYSKTKDERERQVAQRLRDIKEGTAGIDCPFCHKRFMPYTQSPTSTGGNIARGAVFLPWGVVSAVKNKPYVQCPYCGMKIPQG